MDKPGCGLTVREISIALFLFSPLREMLRRLCREMNTCVLCGEGGRK